MSLILYYDTETQDMLNFKERSAHESQPHIVQIAGLLYCDELKRVVNSIDLTVMADGWEIPEDVSKIHGITTELSQKIGVEEEWALQCFLLLVSKADAIKAHNKNFDYRVVRTSCMRHSSENNVEKWAEQNHQCTLEATREYLKPINAERLEEGFDKISASLGSIYEHLFDKPLENAHTAMADAVACMEVDLELQARKQLNLEF
jgi:DNA polymerase-3 subunit epsilon